MVKLFEKISNLDEFPDLDAQIYNNNKMINL